VRDGLKTCFWRAPKIFKYAGKKKKKKNRKQSVHGKGKNKTLQTFRRIIGKKRKTPAE
jgi:hypothetical protein